MLLRKVTPLVAFALVALTAPLTAQGKRVEASFLVGWTFSDGVDVGNNPPILSMDGELFDRIDPQDSFKWGFTVGVNATDSVEVGFQYGHQASTLEAGGTTTREIGDLTVKTYHGYFAYNFCEPEAPVRPYMLFGLGATSFGSVDFTTLNGTPLTIEGGTQFSTTLAAGVKMFPSPNFGVRAGVQWIPTYIKSDAGGYWCDPWFGCYVVGDAQYSSQWDLSAGVIVRF
jgi:hypothetical protein